MDKNLAYIVLDGQYEPSIKGVFDSDHEEAANRLLAALQEGRICVMEMNALDMQRFPYRITVNMENFAAFGPDAYGMIELEKNQHKAWTTEITNPFDNYYEVCVHAKTHRDAVDIAVRKVLKHLETLEAHQNAQG